MSQGKSEEEDLPALKTALTHRYYRRPESYDTKNTRFKKMLCHP